MRIFALSDLRTDFLENWELFGHCHINADCVIEGIRYVQNALKYPRERQGEYLELKKIG